ncbi:MAG: hypothetical protein CBD19_04690 [Gammaproteobacteria bacterium TMED159]|nr:MAG: hypothetical protein CBD19_04690 [Gammaproteobacteria bacterium TMED159]RCL40055.1 MAG: hypothetical protein DBW95_05465 [Gammaproteobacteria bacterium]|tara:strand:+ start:640 stop:1380 length:741 start_codon:yes stop_codon:yes gene_type:complete
MKFIKITLLSLLLISTSAVAQQFSATGMHAGFGVNSVNPVATFQNVSKYMESEDFKKLGITAGLYANNVNGADDTTHLIEFYYPDAASYQKAVDMAATSSAVANLLSTAAQNGTQNTYESVYINVREKITAADVEKNKVFYVWRVETTDLPRYLREWDKMIEDIEDEGVAGDSYGMKVAFAGGLHGESLFVWAGYENQQQMLDQLAVFNSSEGFARFNAKTQSFSSIVANEISTQLALWNGNLYTE